MRIKKILYFINIYIIGGQAKLNIVSRKHAKQVLIV